MNPRFQKCLIKPLAQSGTAKTGQTGSSNLNTNFSEIAFLFKEIWAKFKL
jgi:hypothetical protein